MAVRKRDSRGLAAGLLSAARACARSGKGCSLVVFRSTRLEEVRRERGPALAERLLAQLYDTLSAQLRPSDAIGRAGEDAIGVIVPGGPRAAGEAARRLRRVVAASHRFPVFVGSARARAGLPAQELLRLALASEVAAEEPPAKADESLSPALGARYQRLVLLNRMSHELYAERPFAERLTAACNLTLALTGARHASVYFLDETSEPFPSARHGGKEFDAEVALIEEGMAARAALRAGKPSSTAGCFGWTAAPLLAGERPVRLGVVVVGYAEPAEKSEERERTLLEAGRHIAGARLVERTLEQQRAVAAMKDELVKLVSHEMRTPLTSIHGFAEALLDFGESLSSDKLREYLGVILKESSRLARLVTDFLDVSRIESGSFKPSLKTVDLESLIARVDELLRAGAQTGRIQAKLGPGAARVRADEEQLYRVLVNLCGNAAKFSPPAAPIEVRTRRVDGAAEISVQDRGPGIPREAQSRLFEKFYRVPGPASRAKPGSGLGLAICKGIVDAHGGRIWVESEPGHGACFKFTLPLEPAK